jgi:2-dehydropantoate 2-reductase
MNVMMVGAGAVGGFFGARLVKGGADCSFLLRPRTLEAVQRKGLTVHSVNESFTVHPRAGADPRDLPEADLIILAVKRHDLDAALEQLQPVLTDRTTFLTLQNGVDTEARIQELLPGARIVGGVAYIYAKIAEPGVIEHYKKGAVAIGAWGASLRREPASKQAAQPPAIQGKVLFAKLGELRKQGGARSARRGTPPDPEAIKALFEKAGIGCQIVADIQRTKWEKMCWNVVFNPLTVLIADRVSKALSHPELRAVIERVVEETVAVAKAEGVVLAPDMAAKVIQWSQEIRDIHTSMYDDWKAGRQTEIEHLNGYIVRAGKTLGVVTPVNDTLYALVKTVTEPAPLGPVFLQIDGRVLQPLVLDMEALAKIPAEAQVADVAALVPGMRGQGVRVKALLEVATPAIGADHVTFHSADGQFAASLRIKDAAETGVLIYKRDDEPLPREAGGPFRLVTPGLGDLCANVKGVTRIEFTVGPGKDTRPSVPKHG